MTERPPRDPYSDNGRPPQVAGLLRTPLDLLSSVWLGVFWLVLLLIYSSVGSALPWVRQKPLFEMTEFEWFNWWPFSVLVILFTVSITLVTIRKIKLNAINAGVWMIHGGLVILVAGSYYYFTTKVEGDAPVYRRQVNISVPGQAQPASLVVRPGAQTGVTVGNGTWFFHVQSTMAEWPILSEEDKGKKAFAANIAVTTPTGEQFIRQLLDGYPQYTEDILPGRGRAVKAIGRKLVDETLSLSLDYCPQDYFHVMDTWALYVRKFGEQQWTKRVIEGLPRYNDYIADRNEVFADHPIDIWPIDVEVPPSTEHDALSGADVRISSYLRYAQMQNRWRDGGVQLNPMLSVTIHDAHEGHRQYDLLALDRDRSVTPNGEVQFRYLASEGDLQALPTHYFAKLHVEVPEHNIRQDVMLTQETVAGADGPFTQIEGTPYAYRVTNAIDRLVVPNTDRVVSLAMVDIQTPEGMITRWVADNPSMTRDMEPTGSDPHGGMGRTPKEVDPRFVFTYTPSTSPIIYAALPDGRLFIVFNGDNGREFLEEVKLGTERAITPTINVRADRYYANAVQERKPFVVPPERRERDAREIFAMVRLDVTANGRTQSEWLNFHQYVWSEVQFAYPGRFIYAPVMIEGPDGSAVEVMFSRDRRPLPAPVALKDFELVTHEGGYTGSSLQIRNYESDVVFLDRGQWTEPLQVSVNDPKEFGGFWYFQSMWDRPTEDTPGGGMNYTGLGVGNRNGVYIQLLGCCLSVIGMCYAFYVKPIILRRRRDAARAQRGADQAVMEVPQSEMAVPEPAEV